MDCAEEEPLMNRKNQYTVTCPQTKRITPIESDTDVPCLVVPLMEADAAADELRATPHLCGLLDVKLDGAHNCVVLLTENRELGFIGAAYLAARQRGVYCWRPFTQEMGNPSPDGAGLLPILTPSPLDKNDAIDGFGELLTVGNPYESDAFLEPNPNNWVRRYALHPLLVTPDCCWTGMVTSIAPEVTRRGLTIVVLDKSLRADNKENFRSIVQELQFTCGAQVVELNKPAADSAYSQSILQTALRENHVRVEGDPYGTMLCTLDEFRRVHGGLCNANICCYARMLRKVQHKLGVRALTEAQALEPITLKSRANALMAVRTVAREAKEELYGCETVKKQLEGIVDLMQLDCIRRKRELPTSGHGQILLFAGAPGTGKTTAARMLCDWLRSRGLLCTECDVTYKQVSGAQLKAPYVGNTAPLVHDLFQESAFLFIDEAYALAEEGQDNDNYAQEAMAQLCIELENLPEDRVVVFAGYGGKQNRMRAFLDANPGLASRITATVQFDAYSPDKEMPAIFVHHAAARGLTLPTGWEQAVVPYFTRRAARADYGSGREARRLLESSLTAQAHRLAGSEPFNADALRALTAADITTAIAQLESGFAALNTAKAGRVGI